jgi:hypothetical protein
VHAGGDVGDGRIGVGAHRRVRRPPLPPDSRERPQHPVDPRQPKVPPVRSFKDLELMPACEDLKLQERARTTAISKRPQERSEDCHRASDRAFDCERATLNSPPRAAPLQSRAIAGHSALRRGFQNGNRSLRDALWSSAMGGLEIGEIPGLLKASRLEVVLPFSARYLVGDNNRRSGMRPGRG